MTKKEKEKLKYINSIIYFSDTHVGCRMALCPDIVSLDGGGTYNASDYQKIIKAWWDEFWYDIVPKWTHGEPYAVIFGGDGIDGNHHNTTTQWTHNLGDQVRAAKELLAPIVKLCEGRYYHVRGTEAHVGQSAVEEEKLAFELGAIPNKEGQYARYVIWKMIGSKKRTKDGFLLNVLHHIGTTGSMAYESSAIMAELVTAYSEAGRWERRPPDVVLRAHRHRCIKVEVPTAKQRGIAMTSPGWQGKTPLTHRIVGARQSEPQFGGVLVRVSSEGELYTRHWTRSPERPEEE